MPRLSAEQQIDQLKHLVDDLGRLLDQREYGMFIWWDHIDTGIKRIDEWKEQYSRPCPF